VALDPIGKGIKVPKKEFGKVTVQVSFCNCLQPLTNSEPVRTTFSPGAD
jgi:hypothetical protein